MNTMFFGWIAASRPGLGEGHGEYSASLLENFQSSKEASSKQAKQGLFRIQQRADVLAVLAALASQQKSSQLFWMPWKPGRSLDEAWTKPGRSPEDVCWVPRQKHLLGDLRAEQLDAEQRQDLRQHDEDSGEFLSHETLNTSHENLKNFHYNWPKYISFWTH